MNLDLHSLLTALLAFAVLPLWLAAGAADWFLHRRSFIERTSGSRESWFHVALYLQIALPVVAGLFLRINTLLLVIFLLAVLVHMAFSLWDTSFTQPRRHISPLEQQVHSYLEMLPLFGFAIVLVLHWQALGEREWRWSMRVEPLPRGVLMSVTCALLVGFALIVEELVRCIRVERSPENLGAVPAGEDRST